MTRPLRLVPQAAQPIEHRCPLCGTAYAAYIFGVTRFRIFRCGGCALTFSRASSGSADALGELPRGSRSERDHAGLLAAIAAAQIDGPILVIADRWDAVIPVLERRGLTIGRVVGADDFGVDEWLQTFSAAIVSDALMRVPDPKAALLKIRHHLAQKAPLILSVPLLDGRQARLMGWNWHEWQPTNRWYFTRETLNLLLLASNFESVWFRPERRSYSLDNLSDRVRGAANAPFWMRSLETVRQYLPGPLRRRTFRLPSGTDVVTAVAASPRPDLTVSIIIPVFNERATFQVMMNALLAKALSDMRKEIIIVESNSSDGSRALVESYAQHPDVRIVLQSTPKGKGFAVREALDHATGDIVMIQDADLEYDFDDYDGLLAPLVAWQSMFILGSRHQGSWKMRRFNDAPVTAALFNLGHWIFKSAINLALNTRMTDPFTMFKVFRRDALYGLNFKCNRFDFDIELVMKLVRKGFVPVELPVNYMARSFAEGKKVSFTRDGLTWLWTILKLRFAPIGRGPT